MRTHHSGKELHDQDFVVEGVAFVVAVEPVVEFLAEGLRIMKELEG